MHLNEGEIRASFDQELDPAGQERVHAHLATCRACQARTAALRARAHQVSDHLASLSASPDQAPRPAPLARTHLEERIQISEKEYESMWNKIFNRLSRPAWVGLTIVALLFVSLAFPPVRAIANSFLGLFRVEKVAVVQFDEQALEQRLGAGAEFEQFFADEVQFEEFGETQPVAGAAEAAALAGIPVRLPTQGIEAEPDLQVLQGSRASFVVDLPRVKALLNQLGVKDVDLPARLDGETVTLEIQRAVLASYGDCKSSLAEVEGFDPDMPANRSSMQHCLTLMQVHSPTVSAPQGLDIARIGEAMLQVLGMTQEEAAQFSRSVDWTTTLVVPLPRDNADYREVQVDGVSGILVKNNYRRGSPSGEDYTLIWVKDGILYSLNATGWEAGYQEIIASLK